MVRANHKTPRDPSIREYFKISSLDFVIQNGPRGPLGFDPQMIWPYGQSSPGSGNVTR